MAQWLDAEDVFAGLHADVAKAWGLLQVESDEYDRLSSAILTVCDGLQVAQEEGAGSLTTRAAGIMAWVGQLEESPFRVEITQAFAVACSHYDQEINLKVMSQGFAPVYEDAELDEMEKATTPIVRNLVDRLKEEVLPSRK